MSIVSDMERNQLREHTEYIEAFRHLGFKDLKALGRDLSASWPTVKKHVEELEKLHVIMKDAQLPRAGFVFNPKFCCSLAVAVGGNEIKVAVISFNYETISCMTPESDMYELGQRIQKSCGVSKSKHILCYNTPQKYSELNSFCTIILTEALDFFETKSTIPLLSLAISFPGIIDSKSDTIVFCPNIPEIEHLAPYQIISAKIRDRITNLDVPIEYCHDTTAATVCEKEHLYLNERFQKKEAQVPNLVVLYVGSGVGCGVITNNSYVFGDSGSAGEAGHVEVVFDDNKSVLAITDKEQDDKAKYEYQVDGKNVIEHNIEDVEHPCACGSVLCIEHLIRTKVFNAATIENLNAKTTDELLKTFAQDHPYRYKVLLYLLGRALNICINVYNPGLLIYSGRLLESIPELADDFAIIKFESALRAPASHCQILKGNGRAEVVAIGAAMIASTKATSSNADVLTWKRPNVTKQKMMK